MSQFVAAKIERRLAQLAQLAWDDCVGKADIGMPMTNQAAPKLATMCEEVPRIEGTIRNNRYQYEATVYGRFVLASAGGHPNDAKDERANDLYEAIIGADPERVGRLYDADDNALAFNLRVAGFDRRDYVAAGEKQSHFDVAVTFTMLAEAAY